MRQYLRHRYEAVRNGIAAGIDEYRETVLAAEALDAEVAKVNACHLDGGHAWLPDDNAAGQGARFLWRCASCNCFDWFKAGYAPRSADHVGRVYGGNGYRDLPKRAAGEGETR